MTRDFGVAGGQVRGPRQESDELRLKGVHASLRGEALLVGPIADQAEVFEHHPCMMLSVALPEGLVVSANAALRRGLHLPSRDLKALNVADLFAADSARHPLLRQLLDAQGPMAKPVKASHAPGSARHLRLELSAGLLGPQCDDGTGMLHIVVFDVTEAYRTKAHADEQEQLQGTSLYVSRLLIGGADCEATLSQMAKLILARHSDVTGITIEVAPSSLCGYSASANPAATSSGAARREPLDAVPTQARGGLVTQAPSLEGLASDQGPRGVAAFVHEVGVQSEFGFHYPLTADRNVLGTLDVFGTHALPAAAPLRKFLTQIAENAARFIETVAYRKQLEILGQRDALTGLYNRGYFRRLLESVSGGDGRADEDPCYGVVMVDVDGLKLINDCLGHHAGDEHLVAISGAIAGACRADDCVARLGGDEMAVLVPGGRSSDMARIAARIREALGPQHGDPMGLPLYASIGQCSSDRFEHSGRKAHDVLAMADNSMYLDKRAFGHRRRDSLAQALRDLGRDALVASPAALQ